MQKSIWILGVLAGLGCAFLEYLYFGSTSGDPRVMFLAKAVILAVFLIFGLILIRKLNGGVISLGRTILSGVLISLIRAVVMILVFLSLYHPNGEFYKYRADEAAQLATDQMYANDDVKPADKEMELEIRKSQIAPQFEPMVYSLLAVGSSLVTGLILSVLMAALIGKNMMYEE